MKKAHVIIVFSLFTLYANSQPLVIRGTVTDASTGEAMPFVNVAVLPAELRIGTTTNAFGEYVLTLDNVRGESISFSFLGFQTVTVPLSEISNETQHIELMPLATELGEVVVAGRRERLRNRDNPAVELIRRVIANKDNNRMTANQTYEFKRYEKILMSFTDLSDDLESNRVFRTFPFLLNYVDTANYTGQLSLPFFLSENMSKHYFRQQPQASREILIASQMVDFHDFIEQETIGAVLAGVTNRFDIYDDQIMVLEVAYMSPLSPMAPHFYNFHIIDTLYINGVSCIQLFFAPRNHRDFGFMGSLFVTNDTNLAVKRAKLGFTADNPVNFVNNFSLTQEFTRIDDTWVLTTDDVVIDFGLTARRNLLRAERSNIYTNHRFNHDIPDSIFRGIHNVERMAGFDRRSEQFWYENRPVALSPTEQGVYDMVVDMQGDRRSRNVLALVGMIFSGYLGFGCFELGPMGTQFSFNDVEGARFRLGGKTSTQLSRHLFFEGYVAYGTNDRRFKYHLGAMYSFRPRNLHPWEFPINKLSVSYTSDIATPGQFLQFGDADRLIMSFGRGVHTQMIYHQTFSVNYHREFLSGFSFQPSFTRRIEQPAGSLIYANAYNSIENLTTTQFSLRLRFAPNERFSQVQARRFQLNHTNPIFTLNYSYGMRGFWGGENEFHRLQIGVEKRTWFGRSGLGFMDKSISVDRLWGTVPFPLLSFQPANQSFAYQSDAFSLMNYMEFVSDRSVRVNVSHCFNGLIINRIPLVRRLNLREFISFKAAWGDLSDRNHPENNPALFRFPTTEKSDVFIPTMYAFGRRPYMEVGFGVDNLFRFFRVDVVRRLSYLDLPNVSEWGVRFRIRVRL